MLGNTYFGLTKEKLTIAGLDTATSELHVNLEVADSSPGLCQFVFVQPNLKKKFTQ